MGFKIENFRVIGLFNRKSLNIKIEDNKLVLVGENGSGKSTVLRLLFLFLSGRWGDLRRFQFDLIGVTISGVDYDIPRDELETFLDFEGFANRVIYRDHDSVRGGERLLRPFARDIGSNWVILEKEALIRRRRDKFPKEMEEYYEKVNDVKKKLLASIPCRVFYFPTYRRIEKDLRSIFESLEPSELKKYEKRLMAMGSSGKHFEKVAFGMDDVQDSIDGELQKLTVIARNKMNEITVNYLGGIMNKRYDDVKSADISQVSEDEIKSALRRIQETAMFDTSKDQLFEVINSARNEENLQEHQKLMWNYFQYLLGFQKEVEEKEESFSRFCDVCNKYLVDKYLMYDKLNFAFSIKRKYNNDITHEYKGNDKNLELGDLSSGEKQIVSLFSALYFAEDESVFVIIDEPEMSLSVPWQKRFLPDLMDGGFFAGIVVATHTPVIYQNELQNYASSLGEFQVDYHRPSKA